MLLGPDGAGASKYGISSEHVTITTHYEPRLGWIQVGAESTSKVHEQVI